MISIQFSEEIGDRYEAIRSGELEGLTNKENMGSITEQILKLIAEYEASRVLLAEQEHQLETEQIYYEDEYLQLKEQYMADGMKSTEAKEHAKNDLLVRRRVILDSTKDISLLKANIHSIEYQLRLKYAQLRNEFNISYDEFKSGTVR